MTPTFSVLIAAYNSESTIAETLDSLLAQTRGDWEVIVADDGSTDRTAEIAAQYAARDARIRVRSQPNRGIGAARNLAAEWATSRLWCLLDADDRYRPEYLDRMGAFVDEHPGFDIFSSDGYLFREGEPPFPDALHADSEVRSFVAEDLLVRNRFRVLTIFRREVFDLVGGFNPDRRTMEDWEFWLRALLRGAKHVHDPERLWDYRLSDSQITSNVLACTRLDVFLLETVGREETLSAHQRELLRGSLRTARALARRLTREPRVAAAREARARLNGRIKRGDFTGARADYVRAWPVCDRKVRYVVGLAVMLVSPRLYARLRRI